MNTSSDKITVIIPNWNGEKWLPSCLNAVKNQTFQHFRTIVIDNGSRDRSRSILRDSFPWAETILLPENRGFAAAVNIGIRAAETEYVALLNNDTIPSPDWLLALYDAIRAAPRDVAALASCMTMMDDPGLIDDAGDTLSWFGSALKRGHGHPKGEYQQEEEVFSACAGAALYRRALFEEIGLFDEKFGSYLEDIDLGLRLQLAGYRCRYIPAAEVMHKGHGSAIRKKQYIINMTRNRVLLVVKNIPFPLIIRTLPYLIAGQVWHGVLYRNLFASSAGYLSCIRLIPGILEDRRMIQKKRRRSDDQVRSLLGMER